MKNVFLNLFSYHSNYSKGFISAFLLGVMMFTMGCAKDEKVPSNILPRQKMVSILTDIHELEAKINMLRLEHDSSKLLFNEHQARIFEQHNVSDSLYIKSFDYYMNRVDLMNKIYEAVVDSLSLRKNVERGNEAKEETEDPI